MIHLKTLTQAFAIPSNLFFFSNTKPILPQLLIIDPFYKVKSHLIVLNFSTGRGAVFSILSPIVFSSTSTAFLFTLPNQPGLFGYSRFFINFCNAFRKDLLRISFGNYRVIQFVGFRFRQRWFRTGQALRYKFGYNKRVWFKCPSDFVSIIRKVSPKKRTQFFFSFDPSALRTLVKAVHTYRPSTIYKGRGVNFKEQPMMLKDGKKSLW